MSPLATARVAVPRSTPAPLAATAGALLSLVSLLAVAPLAAQDTLRPPTTTGGGKLIEVPSATAPVVRVSIGDDALVPGDQGRVSVRTRADGYVVVLQADPAGHVRVLYPLDPDDAATQAVRADTDLVVRSRGGGRDAFTAASTLGDGTVLAAFSATRPFRGGRYARNGHWDPRTFPRVTAAESAEGELLAVVGDMLPRGAKFDYDVATYRVSEPLPVVVTGSGAGGAGGGYADQQQTSTDDAYDGGTTTALPAGYGGYYDSYYDGYYGGFFNGYYGGIFPVVVVVPASFRGGRSYHRRGLYPVGIDPFFLSLGCGPTFFSPFARYPQYGDGHGRRGGRGGGGGAWIAYSGPRPSGPHLIGAGQSSAAPRSPYGYKSRPAATRPSGPTLYRPRGGSAGGRIIVAPPAPSSTSRGGDDGATEVRTEPRGWTPMTWQPMQREAIPVYRGSVPRSAPSSSSAQPRQQQQRSGGGGATLWDAERRAAPARSGGATISGPTAAPQHRPAPSGGGVLRLRPR